MLNKRASLEISIQAIVIVVLAMTLLGLGLGFIRGQFRTISETAGSVQEQVKQQILEELRTGDKKLSFPANEVVIEKKDSKVLAVGVKNVKPNDLKFSITVFLINPSNGNREIVASTNGEFIFNKGVQSLEINDARVYPIKYTAPEGIGTRTFEITICDCGTSSAPCATSSGCSGGADYEYDTKTFFLTVT